MRCVTRCGCRHTFPCTSRLSLLRGLEAWEPRSRGSVSVKLLSASVIGRFGYWELCGLLGEKAAAGIGSEGPESEPGSASRRAHGRVSVRPFAFVLSSVKWRRGLS